jgi:hypothetical protein
VLSVTNPFGDFMRLRQIVLLLLLALAIGAFVALDLGR